VADPVQYIDQAGKFTDAFRQAAPTWAGDAWKGPDGQPYKGLDDIHDIQAMTRTLVSQARLVGQKTIDSGVKIPGKDAKPEDVAAYRKAIGVPDKPDGYQYDPPKVPEGVALDEKEMAALQDKTFMDQFRAWAHEIGLPADAFKALASKHDQYVIQSYAKLRDEAKKAEDDAWKTGWQGIVSEQGAGLAENLRLAIQALKAFGGQEVAQLADKLKLHDTPDKVDLWRIVSKSPADVSMLLRIGQRMKTGFAAPNQQNADGGPSGSIYGKDFHEAVKDVS
jgi:hypothetical protein